MSLIILATTALAEGHFIEARALNKSINTQIEFDFNDLTAGFSGNDGAGVALSGRWSVSDNFYVFSEYQAYEANFDVFISEGAENLLTSQETGTRIFSFGIGLAFPVSDTIDLEADLSRRSRKTELEAFSLNLSSGNGSVAYDGTDLREIGLAWRFGLIADLSENLELFISLSGNDSGKLAIQTDGTSLGRDEAYELGVRYGLGENLQVGLSWEESDEGTAALSLRYGF